VVLLKANIQAAKMKHGERPAAIAEVRSGQAARFKAGRTAGSAGIPAGDSTLLEDRETHNLEMILTTYSQEPDPSDWRNADAFKYTLTLK
jgi:hypothetical protein